MKNILKTAAYSILSLAAISCAETIEEGANDGEIRYFEAWMQVNHPDLQSSGLGIYELPLPAGSPEGTGEAISKRGYVYADYTITDLDGNILSYTEADTAKKLGEYSEANYYGPKVVSTIKNTVQAGIADAINGMKIGQRKKVIIPSWLMTYNTYDSAAEYQKYNSGNSSIIYDITIRDYNDSIINMELDHIQKYIAKNSIKNNPEGVFNDRMTNDTTGFYYQPLNPAIDKEKKFDEDTTIYINYTGRLLNGLVFDTTDERIAKDNNIYSASKTYEPVQINWGKSYKEITMGTSSSSVIEGFALTLWQMHPAEEGEPEDKGIGVFYSNLGYTYNGSGSSIPAYAPLIFEIEIVKKAEE